MFLNFTSKGFFQSPFNYLFLTLLAYNQRMQPVKSLHFKICFYFMAKYMVIFLMGGVYFPIKRYKAPSLY